VTGSLKEYNCPDLSLFGKEYGVYQRTARGTKGPFSNGKSKTGWGNGAVQLTGKIDDSELRYP